MTRHERALQILHEGTVIPAIPLVLDANRTLDAAGQRRLIRYYLNAGVGGLAVAVHTCLLYTSVAFLMEEVRFFLDAVKTARHIHVGENHLTERFQRFCRVVVMPVKMR